VNGKKQQNKEVLHAVILDAKTLGDDVSFASLSQAAEITAYPLTAPHEIEERIHLADVVIVNKIKLNEENLRRAERLKLICVAATGYDNIDISYCEKKGIAVCNVLGYSTYSVAQLSVAMVLELVMHLHAFSEFVKTGGYTNSGVPNRLTPAFHELYGKTWGIVGAGNIGGQVATVAEALGCSVQVFRKKPDERYPTVDIDTLCETSDIISVHLPLNECTRGIISKDRIARMKHGAIFVNTARGAVTDEAALADAIESGHLGGLGVDVYSVEPFPVDHPFHRIRMYPNVCMTPHIAWAAIEARQRCMDEIAENIRVFSGGGRRCRVV